MFPRRGRCLGLLFGVYGIVTILEIAVGVITIVLRGPVAVNGVRKIL